ncbi:histidine--tRNA ligase [soil metagenome]
MNRMSKDQIIKAPKGFEDILPANTWKWQAIEQFARVTATLYHFEEIRPPLVEFHELFHRGVGKTTDIVQKETFNIVTRNEEKSQLTLRPEQTAGVVRAMIENGLLNDQGARAKVFYIGPNFRYENPQKGRLRQHHQFGIEAFGIAEPEQDVECILLQLDFYKRCGVRDLSLRVNSLGDAESKQRYRETLVKFLSPKMSQLSEESQRRMQTNPLRILDSKDPRDVEAIQGAPSSSDSLSDSSRAHFAGVASLLQQAGVKFMLDGTLVRGFDYYTGTIWEVTAGGLGAQNALGGGGRYDNLVEQLGGRATPGVGFGSGLERLLIALESQGVELRRPQAAPLVWLVSQNADARAANFLLMNELRAAGIEADMDLAGRAMKAQFTLADRVKADYALIVGEAELKDQTVQIKDLIAREQVTVPRADALDRLRRLLLGLVNIKVMSPAERAAALKGNRPATGSAGSKEAT